MLSEEDKRILEEIIETKGNCMHSTRCPSCPFRSMCLPDFINSHPPTKNQRMKVAFDVLFHNEVLDDTFNIDSMRKQYRAKISE